MDQPKIERVLRLVMTLAHNHYKTVANICEEFDISERTFYRYIDTLRSIGLMINKDEEHGIYKLTSMPEKFMGIQDLVYFSEEEAYVLKAAIESISETNIIKQNLKEKLYSIYKTKAVADVVLKKENNNNVHNLLEAIEQKKVVKLRNYQSAHSNSLSDRLVEPFAFTPNFIQIWCYELDSNRIKLFKVSRIGDVEITLKSWKHEDKHESGFLDIFRMSGPKASDIKLKMSVRAANLLMEEYPLSVKYLSKISENRWLLETKVCGFKAVTRFILGLADDIEIIESQELINYVKMKVTTLSDRFNS
ncbi:MAG: WYL domain-containing protein [Bacteroidales bacterium]|nr:WYL domain-containing protein [Bacteroidales bacterium]